MISIKERIEELYFPSVKNIKPTFDTINNEYFNGKLNIDTKLNYEVAGKILFKITINGMILENYDECINHLERLYELRCIKHKINRINEIN